MDHLKQWQATKGNREKDNSKARNVEDQSSSTSPESGLVRARTGQTATAGLTRWHFGNIP